MQSTEHASEGIHSGFETQGYTSSEVQNRSIINLTKRTEVLQKILKKKTDFHYIALLIGFGTSVFGDMK